MVAKPNSNGRGHSDGAQPDQGMRLELEHSNAMTYEQERSLDATLRTFAKSRVLVVQGEFPIYQVRAIRGALCAIDQVALVDGLIERPGLVAMSLTWALVAMDPAGGHASTARVRIPVDDMGLIGLTLLNRTRHISPARYLQVLAEYQTPHENSRVPGEPSEPTAFNAGARH